jgi:hypothetical protein
MLHYGSISHEILRKLTFDYNANVPGFFVFLLKHLLASDHVYNKN